MSSYIMHYRNELEINVYNFFSDFFFSRYKLLFKTCAVGIYVFIVYTYNIASRYFNDFVG